MKNRMPKGRLIKRRGRQFGCARREMRVVQKYLGWNKTTHHSSGSEDWTRSAIQDQEALQEP